MSSESYLKEGSRRSLTATASVLLGLTVITVALRFYARRRQKASLQADDWIMIPVVLTYAGFCATIYYGESIKVLGYSSHDFTKEESKATLKSNVLNQYSFSMVSIPCLALTKISALLFYRRVFCVSGRKATLSIIVLTTIAVMVLWFITFEFALGFQCGTHLSALWTGQSPKYCKLAYPANKGLAISDVILDVWVMVLPIYPVLKLQTVWTRKLAILAVFLLACIGVAGSILRLYIYLVVFNSGRAAFYKTDMELQLSRLFFFTTLELGVAIIAVNLPSIWMVFASVIPEAFLQSVRSVVSLVSLGSRRSRGSQDQTQSKVLQSNASTSSHVPITGPSNNDYEMNITAEHGPYPMPPGQIQVSRSVEQTSRNTTDTRV